MENKEGVSIIDIFKFIWNKKILLIISTILSFILIFFAGIIFLGRDDNKYQIVFDYDHIPSLNNNNYIDGTYFNYLDLLSEKSLESAISSNEELNNLDIDKLILDPSFTINKESKTEVIDLGNNNNTSTKVSTVYTITISSSYFKSDTAAKDFLVSLAEYPITYNLQILNDNNNNQVLFDLMNNSSSYEDTLKLMNDQINLLQNSYDNLLNTYKDILVKVDYNNSFESIKLSTLKANFTNSLSLLNYKNLVNEYELYKYIKNYDEDIINDEINLLTENIAHNTELKNKYIADINSITQSSGNADLGASLSTYINEIEKLTNQIIKDENTLKRYEEIKKSYSGEVSEGKDYKKDIEIYDRNINKVINELQKQTKIYEGAQKYLYTRDFYVSYRNNHIISKYTTNVVLISIISIIGAVGIGMVVSGFAGYYQYKNKKEEVIEN